MLKKCAYERNADQIDAVNTRLGFRHAMKRLDYVRRIELGKALEFLPLSPGTIVLDVASGRSPWPFYLALKARCRVLSFDLSGSVVWQARRWRRISGRHDLVSLKHDACVLPYADGSFGVITAISALEHIEEDGDARAISELARVLRPGGWLYVTLPYDPRGARDCYRQQAVYDRKYVGTPVFWKRNYDGETLDSRIAEPARGCGLDLQRIIYFGEPGFNFFNLIYTNHRIPLWVKSALFQVTPLASRRFLRVVSREQLLSVPYPPREGTANGVILLWTKS